MQRESHRWHPRPWRGDERALLRAGTVRARADRLVLAINAAGFQRITGAPPSPTECFARSVGGAFKAAS